MTTTRRGKTRGYRFWHHGELFEKAGFPTARAAQEAEWERRRTVGAVGPRHQRAGLSFRAAATRYLEAVVAGQTNPEYKRAVLRGLIARWGDTPFEAVSASDVQAYKAQRLATPLQRPRKDGTVRELTLKGSTVNRDLSYISGLYSWAQRQGLVAHGVNPAAARFVEREGEPWRPWIILTPAQERRLWALLPERERVQAQLLKNLGVRRGVVLGLRWEQIDWRNELVHYTSKGKSGVIPLNQTALALLRRLKPKAEGPVFEAGSVFTLRRHWRRARTQLGLPGLRLHDLRVTFARQLADQGASLKTIQTLLGHSTIIMASRYIPPDLEAQRAAVALLDRPRPARRVPREK